MRFLTAKTLSRILTPYQRGQLPLNFKLVHAKKRREGRECNGDFAPIILKIAEQCSFAKGLG